MATFKLCNVVIFLAKTSFLKYFHKNSMVASSLKNGQGTLWDVVVQLTYSEDFHQDML